MDNYWWKDLCDRNHVWQGLELQVNPHPQAPQAMEMLSGHHGRMSLVIQGVPLFWATMLQDHAGVWLVYNEEHPMQQSLLPPVTSADVESAKKSPDWVSGWCRYFARRLLTENLLSPRRWLLRPMSSVAPAPSPYQKSQPLPPAAWRFSAPASASHLGCDWTLYGEDFTDLTTPEKVTFVDWWWGGNLLLGRYSIDPDNGRLKWWRKKCREGSLPPILVRHIAGLASFVVLDGHYRLQAAIDEGIPPQFLVLSELTARDIEPDAQERERIIKAMERQQRKNPQFSVDAVNQMLINLYDTRYRYGSTHSRAVLGDGRAWEQEVVAYLRRHQLDHYIENILNRVE